jgi:hypothetical protein
MRKLDNRKQITDLISGGFFLAFAATLQPFYNAAGAYSSSGTNALEGEQSPAYAASFGKYLS